MYFGKGLQALLGLGQNQAGRNQFHCWYQGRLPPEQREQSVFGRAFVQAALILPVPKVTLSSSVEWLTTFSIPYSPSGERVVAQGCPFLLCLREGTASCGFGERQCLGFSSVWGEAAHPTECHGAVHCTCGEETLLLQGACGCGDIPLLPSVLPWATGMVRQ